MIDRKTRDRLFWLLKQVALGRIRGFECENALLDLPHDDRIVDELHRTLKEVIGEQDMFLSPIFAKTTKMRVRLGKWLLFLKSDCEYQWPELGLPTGILDFYKATSWDRLTGSKRKIEEQIESFREAGDYEVWPFFSRKDFDQARRTSQVKGLRVEAA